MKLAENDIHIINNLLLADCDYSEIAAYVNLSVADVKTLEILLSKDFQHVANQFNQLKRTNEEQRKT